jgi:RND family efflux transporter MFP subunit
MWGRLLVLFSPFLLVVFQTGCNGISPPARGAKEIEVVVTTPIRHEVTDYQDFTGRMDAFKSVDIRARVTGYVMDVPFKEGDRVHEGDLLFQIDPRTYRADLNQAEANLKQADADRNLQEKVAARARHLIRNGSIGQEEYDQNTAAAEKARATVGAMQAARDRAQLYVDYTRVTAPFDGRISRRYVDPGNLVNADNTVLTTLVTENPMYAYFDVDERTYLDLVGPGTPGQSSWFGGLQYPVLMSLANENDFSRAGTINFIDNQVIATSGTVRMRGVFENPTGTLKKGLFVRIRLPIGTPYQSLLIPDEALLSDQGRKYVYVVHVVDGKNVVDYRSVEIGQGIQGLRVIKKGLSEGEQVIVNGMQRVRPKSEVQVKIQEPPEPPKSPLGKLLASNKEGRQGDKETRRQGDKESGKQDTGPARPGG